MFRKLSLVLLAPLLLLQLCGAVEITGKITSCSGWALNKLRELRSFLKDYEAEEYKGVEVEYIKGRSAILVIFHDGEVHDSVKLSDYKTKEEMHALMVEKGFERKSEDEIEAMKVEKRQLQKEEDLKKFEEREKRRLESIAKRKALEEERKRKEEEEEKQQQDKTEAEL